MSNETIVLDTPAQINAFQYARVISAMSIEFGTGMKISRGGNIWILSYEMGIHNVTGNARGAYTRRHKALALVQARKFCEDHGMVHIVASVDRALASK